ncbi:MAG: hypothetical protein H0U28_02700 [Nocardioidaceae bacterium]|nr:hypothetical protein [Nocardioidaceae bacterium]
MSDDRIRALLVECTDDMPVGPPPDLAEFRAAARNSGRVKVAALGGLAAVFGAAVTAGVTLLYDENEGGGRVTPAATTDTSSSAGEDPVPTSLTCTGPEQVAILENWADLPSPSRETAQEIADGVADESKGERAVVAENDGNEATAVILRADGTAHTSLGLRYDSANGWRIDGFASCAGQRVRLYE